MRNAIVGCSRIILTAIGSRTISSLKYKNVHVLCNVSATTGAVGTSSLGLSKALTIYIRFGFVYRV